MYESPITQILGEQKITYENECIKVVQSYGFDVDKINTLGNYTDLKNPNNIERESKLLFYLLC